MALPRQLLAEMRKEAEILEALEAVNNDHRRLRSRTFTKANVTPNPIPFSTNRRNHLANIQSIVSDPLSDEEMARISEIDKNCRLIKGQVFLWESVESWEDLWDLDGTITT